MNFKIFLGERQGPGGHKQELTEDTFVEMLKAKARNSYTIIKKAPLFLHAEGSEFSLMTPSEKPVRSPFWLDKLISEYRSWDHFPNRTRCIRAYTDVSRVGDGEVYVVIPLDGAKIGVCPDASFYKSFKGVEKLLDLKKLDNDGFSAWLNSMSIGLNVLGAQITEGDVDELGDFKKRLKQIDKFLQEESRTKLTSAFRDKRAEMEDVEKKVVADLLNRHVTNIDTYLEEKLDPGSNGFQNMKIESMHGFTSDREIWISNPCLIVKRERYIDMHKRGIVS